MLGFSCSTWCGRNRPPLRYRICPSSSLGLGGSFLLRLGEALEEERLEELGVEAVLASPSCFVQLVLQVDLVAAVEKPALLLQEVDEHQPVQQDRGVPAPLPFVADAPDQLQERDVLLLKLAEELLGDTLDVEGRLQPPGHFDDADVALGVEFGEVEDHLAELAEEQVAGLALDVEVVARDLLAVLPLDPVPEALGPSRGPRRSSRFSWWSLATSLWTLRRESSRPGSAIVVPRPRTRRPRHSSATWLQTNRRLLDVDVERRLAERTATSRALR